MPSTLPTHPLAVLPLKLWRPRWFDGVALATGSCAPDMAYAFHAHGVPIHTHTVGALFWWSVPCALATAWLIRRGAPAVAAHLPGWLREYGVLGQVRHRWWITVLSALLGAVSHLLWDLVTHPGPVAAWWPIRQASDCSAVVLLPLFLWYVGRRHLVRRWHGDPLPVRRRPVLFWGVSAAVVAAGVLVTWLLGDGHAAWFGYPGYPHVLGVRLIAALTAGPLAGALAVRSAGRRPVESARAADRVPADRPAAPAPVPHG